MSEVIKMLRLHLPEAPWPRARNPKRKSKKRGEAGGEADGAGSEDGERSAGAGKEAPTPAEEVKLPWWATVF